MAFTRVGLYASTYVLSTVSGQQYLPLDHIHPDLGHFRLLDLIQSPILFEETGLNLTDLWRHNPMKMVLGTEIRNSEISCICSYCYWSTIAEISAEQCQFWKSDWKPWNQTAGRSGRRRRCCCCCCSGGWRYGLELGPDLLRHPDLPNIFGFRWFQDCCHRRRMFRNRMSYLGLLWSWCHINAIGVKTFEAFKEMKTLKLLKKNCGVMKFWCAIMRSGTICNILRFKVWFDIDNGYLAHENTVIPRYSWTFSIFAKLLLNAQFVIKISLFRGKFNICGQKNKSIFSANNELNL